MVPERNLFPGLKDSTDVATAIVAWLVPHHDVVVVSDDMYIKKKGPREP